MEILESDLKKDYEMLQQLFNLSVDMLCVADMEKGSFRYINIAFKNTLRVEGKDR